MIPTLLKTLYFLNFLFNNHMKKIVFFGFLSLIISMPAAKACDVCGSSALSPLLGIRSGLTQKQVGLRFQQHVIHAHLGPAGQRTPLSTQERYQSLDFFGSWEVAPRWKVMAQIPYQMQQREGLASGLTQKKSGIGDATLFGFYQLFSSNPNTTSKGQQMLQVGAGVKLPTGAYESIQTSDLLQSNNAFQLGSGSTDLLLQAHYELQLASWGLQTQVLYQYATANRDAYRYGDKLVGQVLLYRALPLSPKAWVAPHVGWQTEWQDRHTVDKQYILAHSGGSLHTAIVGADLRWDRLQWTAQYQAPIAQDLAMGRVASKGRWSVQVAVAF
jgi:hypothetical protein